VSSGTKGRGHSRHGRDRSPDGPSRRSGISRVIIKPRFPGSAFQEGRQDGPPSVPTFAAFYRNMRVPGDRLRQVGRGFNLRQLGADNGRLGHRGAVSACRSCAARCAGVRGRAKAVRQADPRNFRSGQFKLAIHGNARRVVARVDARNKCSERESDPARLIVTQFQLHAKRGLGAKQPCCHQAGDSDFGATDPSRKIGRTVVHASEGHGDLRRPFGIQRIRDCSRAVPLTGIPRGSCETRERD